MVNAASHRGAIQMNVLSLSSVADVSEKVFTAGHSDSVTAQVWPGSYFPSCSLVSLLCNTTMTIWGKSAHLSLL